MSPKRRRHRTRDAESVAHREEEVGLGVGSAAQRYAAYKAEAQAASSLRARWVSTLSFTPDPFQIQALDAVEAGNSVLVAAPTGAGKTIVGQFGARSTRRRSRHCPTRSTWSCATCTALTTSAWRPETRR